MFTATNFIVRKSRDCRRRVHYIFGQCEIMTSKRKQNYEIFVLLGCCAVWVWFVTGVSKYLMVPAINRLLREV